MDMSSSASPRSPGRGNVSFVEAPDVESHVYEYQSDDDEEHSDEAATPDETHQHGDSTASAAKKSADDGEADDDDNSENDKSVRIASGDGGAVEFSDKEVRYFKKMFEMFDTDNSGAIGFYEMKNLARHLGVELTDEALKSSMDEIDENGNGDLEFEEFVHWLANVNSGGGGDQFAVLKSKIRAQGTRPLSNAQIEQLREVFQHFDADDSGTIDIDELGNVFRAMGQELGDEELKTLMSKADDDGSGEIDFDEFLLLMCSSFGATHSFDQDLLDAFRKYDATQSGMIACGDLEELIKSLVGPNMTHDEVKEVVDVAHERGDGYVEYMRWEALWDACRGVSL